MSRAEEDGETMDIEISQEEQERVRKIAEEEEAKCRQVHNLEEMTMDLEISG
jgi:hypothetical protein